MEWMMKQDPVILALLASLFTWFMTSLGAAMVFLFREIKQKILNMMLGFAAGVMIAASFWSLLEPALDKAQALGQLPWLSVGIGFLTGGAFLWLADHLLPHMHFQTYEKEGVYVRCKRSILLVLSITLHNIPEGLAIGVAFGALDSGADPEMILAVFGIALGIGIQNFPEGAAVSIPLRKEGLSNWKCFLYGQGSGIVEPLAAVAGALMVRSLYPLLPYALSFAAGAMIYVVVEELIPEAQLGSHEATHLATIGCMLGFTIMMILDVALG